jgi:hypothetical protein
MFQITFSPLLTLNHESKIIYFTFFVRICKKLQELVHVCRDFPLLQKSSHGNVKAMKIDYSEFVVFGYWNC